MNKSTFFSGQPVFAQLIKFIPDSLISRITVQYNSDRYYKTFMSRDHLISMLYACFHNCTSLREVTTGLEASYNKLLHLGMKNVPRRSTLSDANARRPVEFFEDLFHELYSMYHSHSPDSRSSEWEEKQLFIMDSSTISLFSDVMKGAGEYGFNGRKKGGIKAHVLLNASKDVPAVIYLTESARNDKVVMPKISPQKGDILVFDKGYQNFQQWQQWNDQQVTWVTRVQDNQYYEILDQKPIDIQLQQEGVCDDQKIHLGRGSSPSTTPIVARLISFYVPEHKKIYHYLTNNFTLKASTIAGFYKKRWSIETFFKRIKQNNPLRYFLGDNENAIRIQLWCAFIKDLLVKIVKDQLKRRWAFSNISAMIRHHLMNYLNLFEFLNQPEKMRVSRESKAANPQQIKLFAT